MAQVRDWSRVIDRCISEVQGSKQIGSRYNIIKGNGRQQFLILRPEIAFEVRIRWFLLLFSTDFKTGSTLQQTMCLTEQSSLLYLHQRFCAGALEMGKRFATPISHGKSILRVINGFGMPKSNVKPYSLPASTIIGNLFSPFHFCSCGGSFLIFQLRSIFAPKKPCFTLHQTHSLPTNYCLNTLRRINIGIQRISY